MLMKPDKKKNMASLIIGASAPNSLGELKSANAEVTDKPEMDAGLLAAADEMMSALEAKDVQGFAEAMQSFMSMADQNDAPAEPQE